MIHIPAQHNTLNPPGQVVNKNSGEFNIPKTLKDQLERHEKYDGKKLSFEEWYTTVTYEGNMQGLLRMCWNHSRSNM